MEFRTELSIAESAFKINHTKKGILLGSCFTDYIGQYMFKSKFSILANPLGTVYNPISIVKTFHIISNKKSAEQIQLFNDNGIWKSYDLHSSCAAKRPESVVTNIKNKQKEFIAKTTPLNYIILSLGTSVVYELVETKEIVCNCHKTQAQQFAKRKLSVTEIIECLKTFTLDAQNEYPGIEVIFTISPIRHWKDGYFENQVSKSSLFIAIDEIISSVPNTQYFPAYEILMDDLRDYRFYGQDMLHPNPQAIAYVWNKFSETYFTGETKEIIKQMFSISQAMEHTVFYADSTAHKTFAEKQLKKCKDLQAKHPYINLSKEISYFEKDL